MRVLAISVLVVSMVTGLQANMFAGISQALGFSKIEEPGYTVVENIGNDVQIRDYVASKWVGITVQSVLSDYNQKNSGNFMKLFGYISGKNDQKMKIEMTAPVAMAMSSASSVPLTDKSQADVTMSFFVGKNHQANTPVPNDNEIKVQSVGARTVATIRFGGWATMEMNIKKRDELIKALGARASQYDTVNMVAAGYDAPFKLFNRRNEVWLVKK